MINKAILLGRVGKKENKTTKSGHLLISLSIATEEKFKDSTGTQQKITNWHNVNCFNKVGEIVDRYVFVGDLIYIEGKIQHKKVTLDNGDRWMYSVTASEVKLLPKSQKSKEESTSKPADYNNMQQNFNDDDVPF